MNEDEPGAGIIHSVRTLLETGRERIAMPPGGQTRAAIEYPRRLTDGGGPPGPNRDPNGESYEYSLPAALGDAPIIEQLEQAPAGITVINNSFQTVWLDLAPRSGNAIPVNAIVAVPPMGIFSSPYPDNYARDQVFGLAFSYVVGLANSCLPGKVTVIISERPVPFFVGTLLPEVGTGFATFEDTLAPGASDLLTLGLLSATPYALQGFPALGFDIASIAPPAGGAAQDLHVFWSQDPAALNPSTIAAATFFANPVRVPAGVTKTIPVITTGIKITNISGVASAYYTVEASVLGAP